MSALVRAYDLERQGDKGTAPADATRGLGDLLFGGNGSLFGDGPRTGSAADALRRSRVKDERKISLMQMSRRRDERKSTVGNSWKCYNLRDQCWLKTIMTVTRNIRYVVGKCSLDQRWWWRRQ